MGLALISFILTSIPGGGGAPAPMPPASTETETEIAPPPGPSAENPPPFMDDGDLFILRTGQEEPLVKLDVEFATDRESITQGLMFRQEMELDQGMLFLMPSEEPQSFWMRNTYIPLDIIFANANKEIVKIRANTTPLSEDQVTSEVPAAYVLEVNAGYAERNGLKEGDRLEW